MGDNKLIVLYCSIDAIKTAFSLDGYIQASNFPVLFSLDKIILLPFIPPAYAYDHYSCRLYYSNQVLAMSIGCPQSSNRFYLLYFTNEEREDATMTKNNLLKALNYFVK